MEARLEIRNFGPIRNVSLKLKNVNVLIGPQASGKSAIAKLYTVFSAPRKFLFNNGFYRQEHTFWRDEKTISQFINALDEYNIASFLNSQSEIVFDSNLHWFSYKHNEIEYFPKLYDRIVKLRQSEVDYYANRQEIITALNNIRSDFFNFRFLFEMILKNPDSEIFDDLNFVQYNEHLAAIAQGEQLLSSEAALYIPAERGFSNIIKKAALNLLLHQVPIPRHILSFGAELEKINIESINLDFLNEKLVYRQENGLDRIYFDANNSITLTESASGIQSVVPILLPIQDKSSLVQKSFIIEEPELNIFPSAQYRLLQLLEQTREKDDWQDVGSVHIYTTHSPYILSGMNNMLLAARVANQIPGIQSLKMSEDILKNLERERKRVLSISGAIVKPFNFSAYQIDGGIAESILDVDSGLIKDNFIDDSSDIIDEDFGQLLNLLDEYRQAKTQFG